MGAAFVRVRSGPIAALVVVLLAAALFWLVPAAPPAEAQVAPTALRWTDCGDGFQCAIARVPLDHGQPRGPTTRLSLIRLPASGPGPRIGSLFVNPGGPGGSGVDLVQFGAEIFPEEVRARYDLVGVDPRGVARSDPLRCFGSFSQLFELLPPFAFPTSPDEEAQQLSADLAYAAGCERRARDIIDFMSTADAARDLDLLREAVGDERLHFLGLSYGSYLGVTYANLFPERVGMMVVDGVLDPVAWSTGRGDADTVPFSARLGSQQGSRATLQEFFRLCDEAGDACAFSGGAEARFAELAERLLVEPVVIVDPEFPDLEFLFTYADLVGSTLGALYDPLAWPFQAEFLASVEAGSPPPFLGASLDAVREHVGLVSPRRPPAYFQFFEGFDGVACADSDNPDDQDAWIAAAAAADAEAAYFGRLWTWASSHCAVWPGNAPNRYAGPWDATTATPVLVVGNRFDPATPYSGAEAVADLLPRSRLLTYDGWGHTALFTGDPCVTAAIGGYLVGGVLPAAGASCPAPPSPFSLPPVASAEQGAGSQWRASTLPAAVRRAFAAEPAR